MLEAREWPSRRYQRLRRARRENTIRAGVSIRPHFEGSHGESAEAEASRHLCLDALLSLLSNVSTFVNQMRRYQPTLHLVKFRPLIRLRAVQRQLEFPRLPTSAAQEAKIDCALTIPALAARG